MLGAVCFDIVGINLIEIHWKFIQENEKNLKCGKQIKNQYSPFLF